MIPGSIDIRNSLHVDVSVLKKKYDWMRRDEGSEKNALFVA